MSAVTNDGHYTARAQRRPDGGIDVRLGLMCNGEHVETHTVWEDGTTELQAAREVLDSIGDVQIRGDELATVNGERLSRMYAHMFGAKSAEQIRQTAIQIHEAMASVDFWWDIGKTRLWGELTIVEQMRLCEAAIAVLWPNEKKLEER